MKTIPVGDFIVNLSEEILGDQNQNGGRMFKVYKGYKNDFKNYCGYLIKQSDIQRKIIDDPLLIMGNQDLNYNVLRFYDQSSYEDNHLVQPNKLFFIYIGESCDMCLENYLVQRLMFPQSSSEIINILSQIVNGYYYLHNQKLKPIMNLENIYIIKLIDNSIIVKLFLDIYKYANANNIKYIQYLAPETLEDQNNNDSRSDIFSLGIILYQLCYQFNPFYINNITQDIRQDILKKQKSILQQNSINLPNNSNISPQLQNLIRQMLVYNPQHRITWQQLKENYQLNPKFLILDNKYYINLQSSLGCGGQGIAFEAISLEKKQEFYAAKRISNQSPEYEREIQIYRKIKSQDPYSPNVIQIYEIKQFQNQFTFIIMEKCDDSLKEYFRNNSSLLTDSDIIDIMYQITLGYIFLKKLHIIHRDLKPQNILVKIINSKPYFKIIDLGLGKILNENELAVSKVGTLQYFAPEVFNGSQNYDHQCDIFSLGVIFYEMVYQQPHANIQNYPELKQFFDRFKQNDNIITYGYKNASGGIINPYIISLIKQMLLYDPNQRITWEQFKLQLESIKNKPSPQIKSINTQNQQAKVLNHKIHQIGPRILDQNSFQPFYQDKQEINLEKEGINDEKLDIKGEKQGIKEEEDLKDEKQERKVEKQIRKQEKKISLYHPSVSLLDIKLEEQQQQQQKQIQNDHNQGENRINDLNVYINTVQSNEHDFLQENYQQVDQVHQQNFVQNQELNQKMSLNCAKLEEFYIYLSKFVEQSSYTTSEIGVDLIIASLLIKMHTICKNIKQARIQQADKLKETIVIFYLLHLATDVLLDNLFILSDKKEIVFFDHNYSIKNGILGGMQQQTIILMKRYTRLDWNYSLQTIFNNEHQAGIKDYIQKIQNYYEIMSKQSNYSCLDGLEYFFEYYCQSKAQVNFPQLTKNDMDSIYEIHEKTDIEDLKQHIKKKFWDFIKSK